MYAAHRTNTHTHTCPPPPPPHTHTHTHPCIRIRVNTRHTVHADWCNAMCLSVAWRLLPYLCSTMGMCGGCGCMCVCVWGGGGYRGSGVAHIFRLSVWCEHACRHHIQCKVLSVHLGLSFALSRALSPPPCSCSCSSLRSVVQPLALSVHACRFPYHFLHALCAADLVLTLTFIPQPLSPFVAMQVDSSSFSACCSSLTLACLRWVMYVSLEHPNPNPNHNPTVGPVAMDNGQCIFPFF
jgi:hypothetical protein